MQTRKIETRNMNFFSNPVIRALANSFDFLGEPKKNKSLRETIQDDQKALQNDWVVVGKDMKKAMAIYESQEKLKLNE